MYKGREHIHFMGIGGIGMSAIARYFNAQGVIVSGYDKTPTPLTDTLQEEGIQIHFEDNVELIDKEASLPKDIQWHFIGHLQSNKVKYIAPFVHLIHGVDSEKLLQEINKQAAKQNRVINCLLQVHIATEETKFGFDEASLNEFIQNKTRFTSIRAMLFQPCIVYPIKQDP